MGTGPSVTELTTAERVAEVRLPRVEGGVLGVAVAPLVPGHDPPPGFGQQRGEAVEGAGEVEPAVRQRQRRRAGVAPLVHRDAQPVGLDRARPVGRPGAGEGDRLEHGGKVDRSVKRRQARTL